MNPHPNPTIVVETVERIRHQVDALLWTGIVLGLLFTMINVHDFAAAGALAFSLVWWAAWLLDPMVSLVLIAILRAERITARHQVAVSPWVRRVFPVQEHFSRSGHSQLELPGYPHVRE